MRTLDETDRLLDLLREAGDEPVSLDELEVVGLRDPSRALLELELAGHAVHRVYETVHRGRRITCVRLALTNPTAPEPRLPAEARGRAVEPAARQDAALPVRAPRPVTPTVLAAGPLTEAVRRFALAALLGALLVALLRGLRR